MAKAKTATTIAKKESTTNITPLGGNVLIRPIDAEQKTSGGIILPDSAKEKPQMGIVMAVGEGAWNEDGDARIKMTLKSGDKVIYKKWGGNEIKVENEEWTIVEEKDILAKIG